MMERVSPDILSGNSIDRSTKNKPASQAYRRDMVQDFKTLFSDSIKKTVGLQKNAENMTQKMVAGDVEDIHQVMIAAEKAKIAFRFTMEVKNKIMSAYQELQRMQI
ncbi:MAG: flagellar hook-basal body complex protein FliE [Candidatus Muiribacterium halophilum]|uniref:Flagellar hook-basal body complex protein FliE n=1 Tax=Muiribacterium halophilum TaxID=2053465 RepID=A0A2N5ZDJ7_MUIH1|nr:MAG: flagellar hook-basal body complex protein FliE [Candidatus Muirbacterium halophilum]